MVYIPVMAILVMAPEDSILYGILGFIWAEFLWEIYLSLRQVNKLIKTNIREFNLLT